MPLLGFDETRRMLAKYSLPAVKSVYSKNAGNALSQAKKLRPPFVLKAVGPSIMHKTEKGLVAVGIHTLGELSHNLALFKKKIEGEKNAGFLVQETVRGAEFIIGAKRDASFGAVVLFGTGGIYAELLDDVAVRTAPLTREDALQMIGETKARKFLEGFRSMKVNREQIVSLLQKTSLMIEKEKSVVEADFNPVIADSSAALIADARVVVQ